jgi:CBS domain-containing membrane protein
MKPRFYVVTLTVLWSFAAVLFTGLLATATHRPFLFPSLGPSALLIFAFPSRRESSARIVLAGHAIGAGCGYLALLANGLLGAPYTPTMTGHRVIAAAMALALTAALMLISRMNHTPAGATTLLVSLGVLPSLWDFLWLMLGVIILIVLGAIANCVRTSLSRRTAGAVSASRVEPR